MHNLESVYVHIPFCLKKCHYCSFCSYPARPDSSEVRDYVEALILELNQEAVIWQNKGVRTVYIGGGTPSMLPAGLLMRLLNALAAAIPRVAETEWTLEANPGTGSREFYRMLKDSPVNRLSLGIQSANDTLLRQLGRIHNWQDAHRAYDDARDAGFDNISVDLIFGLPGQDRQDWQRTLSRIVALTPDHVSAYSLQVEKGTVLAEQVDRKEAVLPGEDAEEDMWEDTREMLQPANLWQYEVSNYACTGKESRHNRVYWHNEPYRGLGAGAFSYRERTRSSHTPDPALYIQHIREGRSPRDWEETVTREAEMEETMMMAMRMVAGVSQNWFEERFGSPPEAVFPGPLAVLQREGLLTVQEKQIAPTLRGLRFNNRIGREFLGSIT